MDNECGRHQHKYPQEEGSDKMPSAKWHTVCHQHIPWRHFLPLLPLAMTVTASAIIEDVLHDQLVSYSLRAPNSSSVAFAPPPPGHPGGRSIPIPDVLKASALFLLVLWTVFANLLVFIVLYKNPRLQTVPNLLVGNLAFSDFCLALVVLPLSSIYACAGEWLFNETLCQVFVSADILCSTASIWNLSIVGLDRYWAITHPVQYLNKRNKKTACLMILSVWSFSALISLSPLLGWKQMAEHGNLVQINGAWQCTFLDLPSYTVYSATGSFFIPTLLMFFVYFKIYQAFAKHRARQIYRQKVIRRHIESTILHEISHILPTSDEFAKEVEDEEEEEEEEEEDEDEEAEEEEGEQRRRRQSQVDADRENGPNSVLRRRVEDPLHPTIYEEDEDEKDLVKEEDDDDIVAGRRSIVAPRGFVRRQKSSSLCGNTPSVEKNGSALRAQQQKEHNPTTTTRTAKVAFKNTTAPTTTASAVTEPVVEQRASILVRTKKQWKSFSHVEGTIGDGAKVESVLNKDGSAEAVGEQHPPRRRSKSRPMDAASMPPYEKVRRHKRRKELNFRKSLQGKPRAISAAKERRGVRVLGIILGCFTLCWTPFFVMYVVLQFCSHCSVNPHIEMFITWLGYSNSGMNPIIYTVFNRDYQIALKRLFIGRRRSTGSSIIVGGGTGAVGGGGGRSALVQICSKNPIGPK